MGWKANVIFAAEEPGYFATLPTHSEEIANFLRDRLGLSKYERTGESDFGTAMYPRDGGLYIGAYPRGIIICESDLPSSLFDEDARGLITGAPRLPAGFKANLLGLYPRGQVLAIILHSVVDLWAYSLYTNGQHVRTAAGASDDGLFANLGALIPEESKVLKECPFEDVEEEGLGEELVFEVATRLVGGRLDEMNDFNPKMTRYARPKTGPLTLVKNLFSRR